MTEKTDSAAMDASLIDMGVSQRADAFISRYTGQQDARKMAFTVHEMRLAYCTGAHSASLAVERVAVLESELKLWRMLVNEGGVPRYTVTPGAALNTVVTSTDALLRQAALKDTTP